MPAEKKSAEARFSGIPESGDANARALRDTHPSGEPEGSFVHV